MIICAEAFTRYVFLAHTHIYQSPIPAHLTYNGSSTVDYYLCSPDLFEFVCGFDVKYMNMYSDHCPISLEINSLRLPTQRVSETVVTKMVLDVEKVRKYQHYLSTVILLRL